MKKLKLLYFVFVIILCISLLNGCNKSSDSPLNKSSDASSNNEQSSKTLKSLEAMMATIEVMDKHNPFQLPYPGLGDPSYYQKMKLNYIEYTGLLTATQAEINILKRSKVKPDFLKAVEDAFAEFIEIGRYLPFMLTGTGYRNNTELKISLGVKSYDELVTMYKEACKKASSHMNNAYNKL